MKSNSTRKENSQPKLAFLQNLLGGNEEGHEGGSESGYYDEYKSSESADDDVTDDKPGMLMSREELLMKMETWELLTAKFYEYCILEEIDYRHHLIEIYGMGKFI